MEHAGIADASAMPQLRTTSAHLSRNHELPLATLMPAPLALYNLTRR